MTFKSKTQNTPFNQSLWQGRIDTADGEKARRWHQMIQPFAGNTDAGVTLIGYPCDLGVAANKGRTGASEGPDQLRRALAKLPWHHTGKVYDAGNIQVQAGLAETQQQLAECVADVLHHQCLPLVIGGGHDVAWGSFQGLRAFILEQSRTGKADLPKIGIINFDAHFDLRSDSEGPSSGTPFYQVARDCSEHGLEFHYAAVGISRLANTQSLYDRADELKVTWIADTDAGIHQIANAVERMKEFLDQIDAVYITIDMDAFPASVAPGVSAPAPRGISVELVETLLQQIRSSQIPVLLAEIAEFNPSFDIDDHTARLGARLAALLTDILEHSRVRGSLSGLMTELKHSTTTSNNNSEASSHTQHD
ncbi:formimidoylglutamase [Hahella ganghwensis]|uniref:formimidoylglutamase n=1 Tax=Hahella ganghwensis TaxID=286420 RepID=UPI0003767D8D|nr:formimidoylglutamase [Hahella ganghwensis]